MSTRITIVCEDGDMLARTLDGTLTECVDSVSDILWSKDGFAFEAFGRVRLVRKEDVAELNFKEVKE